MSENLFSIWVFTVLIIIEYAEMLKNVHLLFLVFLEIIWISGVVVFCCFLIIFWFLILISI